MWRDNGQLNWLGPSDDQIKLRRVRIELGEIESTIERVAPVKKSAVRLVQRSTSDTQLVAYVVPPDALEENLCAVLRQALAQELPESMVPTYFVELRELPLLTSGKIRRNSLKKPDWQGSGPDSNSEAPNGEFEISLAAAWKQPLHVDTVDRHDSFFELGGH